MDDSAPLMHVDWIRWLQNLATSVQQPLTAGMIPDIPFTKIAMTASPRLLGRTTAGAGAAEQITVTAPLTLAAGALGITGSALTKTDDTNITATLTGTPATALLAAVNIALGWTGTLSAVRGGTGTGSYAVGDVLYADTTTTLAKLADVSAGSYLRSGGVGVAPLWSTAKLPNTATTGDVLYASASNVYSNLADVAAGSYLRSGGVTTAPVWSTLVLPNSAATGDLLYASGSNTLTNRTIGSTSDVLTVVGGVPTWSAAASVATNVTITNDTTTNATMFPTWVTANSGNLPLKVSSTKLSLNPSTGLLTTGPVTSSGDFTTLTGHVYIGAVDSRFWIYVDKTITADTLNYAFFDQLRIDSTSVAITSNQVGNFAKIAYLAGANNVTTLSGARAEVQRSTTAAGTLGSAFGVHSNVHNDVAGAITTAYGFYSIVTGSAAGTIGTGYGLYLDTAGALRPTASWGVYQVDDSSTNAFAGRTRFGNITAPTALVHMSAGTATANTAPFKFTSGTLLGTAEAGAVEFLTDDYFVTITTGAARKGIILDNGSRLTSGNIPIATTNGRLIDGPSLSGSVATGDLLYGSGANALSRLADVAVGSYLRSGGVSTAPLWSTLILPNAATANRVVYATSANTYGESANLTFSGTDLAVTGTASFSGLFSASSISQTAKTTKYNNVTTAGWGVPAIYTSSRLTAQIGAVVAAFSYTVGAADGSFLVSANVFITTATTFDMSVIVNYTDEGNTARSAVIPTVKFSGAFFTHIQNTDGAGPYQGVPIQLRCKASTAITFSTTGTFTTVTYNIEGFVAQIA